MKTKIKTILLTALMSVAFAADLHAQSTAFTYQGQLSDTNGVANGSYDITFTLYDSSAAGTAVAGPVTNSTIVVSNGLFTTTVDFGTGMFDGSDRWLEIGVRTNGDAGGFAALSPRQQITSVPYAVRSANAATAAVANNVATGGVTAASIQDASITSAKISNYSVARGINGLQDWVSLVSGGGITIAPNNLDGTITLTVPTISGMWLIGGNSVPYDNEVFGPTNNVKSLDIRVGADRPLRLENPGVEYPPNIIGGDSANAVTPYMYGGFVGGGGGISNAEPNLVTWNYGAVVGGLGNSAGYKSFVGGGEGNVANNFFNSVGGGNSNVVAGTYSHIGGGSGNYVSAPYSSISGGEGNEVSGGGVDHSFIGGGWHNTNSGVYAVVAGGEENIASGIGSSISGGSQNQASGGGASISGGAGNRTPGAESAILGGQANVASGIGSVVLGGSGNLASGDGSVVLGGVGNVAAGQYSVAGGSGAHAINGHTFIWNSRIYSITSSVSREIIFGADRFTYLSDYPANTFAFDPQAVFRVGGNADFDGTVRANSFIGDGSMLSNLAFRLENPGVELPPNIIGGDSVNAVSSNMHGGFIGGGGGVSNTEPNLVTWDYGAVVGGLGNSAGYKSFVGGGEGNVANSFLNSVVGGSNNVVNGLYSHIGGGNGNYLSASDGSISGGGENVLTAHYAFIGGGLHNTNSGWYAVVAGGENNIASGNSATISGGSQNQAGGLESSITGGAGNRTTTTGADSAILGGHANVAAGMDAVVLGGSGNAASGAGSVVLGGVGNEASGEYSVAGGYDAHAIHDYTFIWNDTLRSVTSSIPNEIIFSASRFTFNPGYPPDFYTFDSQSTFRIGGNGEFDGNVRANYFIGDGSKLTNIVATTAYTANYATTAGAAGSADNFSGSLSGEVTGGQNSTIVSKIMGEPLAVTTPGTNQFLRFDGSNWNAAAVNLGTDVSGTLQLAQMPANVITNGATGVSLAGTFTGVGSNLADLDASHLTSGTVPSARLPNFQSPNYTTVGGGAGNTASNSYATVGGGFGNTAGGIEATISGGTANIASGDNSFIGGGGSSVYGDGNTASGKSSAVVGGRANVASGNGAFVGGGGSGGLGAHGNTASGMNSTVPGGEFNVAAGTDSFAAGQRAKALNRGAFVWADSQNTDFSSTTNDQFLIRAQGGVGIGKNNPSSALDVNGMVTATAFSGSGAGLTSLNASQLSSGTVPLAQLPGFQSPYETIGGGTGNTNNGTYATVGGGYYNSVTATKGTIGGGDQNHVNAQEGTVAGGQVNTAGGAYQSTVGGGFHNQATASYATIPGGYGNTAGGQYSFAAGHRAMAINQGAFVWADSQNADFSSTANDQFLIRSQGGVGINTTSPTGALSVNTGVGTLTVRNDSGLTPAIDITGGYQGTLRLRSKIEIWPSDDATYAGRLDVRNTSGNATISLNGQNGTITCTTLNQTSDRNAKENFAPVNDGSLLEKIAAMPISEWNYKSDPSGQRHIGPMAQDFHAAFGLNGTDDKHISVIDEGGVALAAIKGLDQELIAKDVVIKKQATEIADLETRLAKLERSVHSMQGGVQ